MLLLSHLAGLAEFVERQFMKLQESSVLLHSAFALLTLFEVRAWLLLHGVS